MEFILTHPDTGTKSILVLFDGVPYEADSDHPWWEEIVDLVLKDDPRVLDLFPIRRVQQPSEYVHSDSCCGSTSGEYEESVALNLSALSGQDGRRTSEDDFYDNLGIPCDDEECYVCHPFVAPGVQARAEVNANLNYMNPYALPSEHTVEGLQRERDKLLFERDLLAAAVRNYADHAWNDISHALGER